MTLQYVPGEWAERAKCLGEATEIYDAENFDIPGGTALARRLCAGCPVMRECAQWAIKTKASGVVYAGIPLGISAGHQGQGGRRRLRAIANGEVITRTKGVAA